MMLADLALLLDAPVEALRGPKPEDHVWHISVRNAPDDRVLSDAEWAEVAAAMVHAAGIDEHGDEQACRWIAVRHAPDHIHILATLARQDGRHPGVRGDILAMHTAARTFEARWGLTPMSPLDRTARRRPVTGEAEKAARRGLAETARESLQRTVRTAAALAHGDTDFLDRFRGAGLRVRERRDDGWCGTRSRCPETAPTAAPVSTLAYDLSLPRVRERFEPVVTPADSALAEHRIREASMLPGRAGRRRRGRRSPRRPLGGGRRALPGPGPRPRPGGGRRVRAGRPRPRRPLPRRPRRPCRMARLDPGLGGQPSAARGGGAAASRCCSRAWLPHPFVGQHCSI
ncbi:hypothetical protein OG321_41655 [Streptomyces sp. NBC_00424]|uniref:hypothetical protein n=1 Tax=Streptomyces sp. NBC_00424 TaxID=2903648 RepID=UPI00225A3866|nr:hypothetical protein [Streptomyces sp. NBC_00424]MCX5078564.1 hypothetical protein [Streptomyces sp. NBC_00424]MCX5078910.1 hypothetical protein [Streptomyces sp. NBC_00424]